MNNPLLANDSNRWLATRRRWTVVLATLLTINFTLVVMAGYSHSTPATAAVSPESGVVPSEQPNAAEVAVSPPSPAPVVSEPVPTTSEPTPGPSNVSAIAHTPEIPAEVPATPTIVPVDPTAIVIVNSLESGGVVHFLLEDAVCSLEPGEYQEIHGAVFKQVTFHKGDAFENQERLVRPGVFVFDVADTGWQLVACPENDAATALSGCRKAVSK